MVLADPGGSRRSVRSSATRCSGGPLDLDDVAFSTVRQPDTAISGATLRRRRAGTLQLFSTGAARVTYSCSLDSAEFAPCSNPYTAAGLAVGTHTLSRDAPSTPTAPPTRTPAQVHVHRGRRRGRRQRRSARTRPTTARQRPTAIRRTATATASATPASSSRPATSRRSRASTRSSRQLSGEVFVKLPAKTTLGFRGMRAPFQESGFVRSRASRRSRSARPSTPARARSTWSPRPTATRPATAAPAGSRRASRPASSRSSRSAPSVAGQGDVDRDRRHLISPPGAEAACAARLDQGRRALGLDGRQGLLPHDRRREHGHRRATPRSRRPTAATAR